jgi:flagellar biosynthetic protein FlhB
MALGIIMVGFMFWMSSGYMVESSMELTRDLLAASALINFDKANILDFLWHIGWKASLLVMPVAFTALFVGVLSTLAQIGFIWTGEPLKPDLNRVNPVKGMQRYLSWRTPVDTAKAVFKFIIIGGIAYSILSKEVLHSSGFLHLNVQQLAIYSGKLIFKLMFYIGSMLLVLGLFDYLWQKFDFLRKMKMTKHELKEETKQREGDPHVKARVRSIQMQAARRRMLEDVKDADVIVTNPTHYAVAIKYNKEEDIAPRLLAKGADYIAFKIREIAKENNIPIVENPPLARGIYKKVKLGKLIPANLYKAIAEVLAFVYRLKASGTVSSHNAFQGRSANRDLES